MRDFFTLFGVLSRYEIMVHKIVPTKHIILITVRMKRSVSFYVETAMLHLQHVLHSFVKTQFHSLLMQMYWNIERLSTSLPKS